MATACRKLYNSEPTIRLCDQFEDRKVGLRMITFTTAIQQLEGGGKVCLRAGSLWPGYVFDHTEGHGSFCKYFFLDGVIFCSPPFAIAEIEHSL